MCVISLFICLQKYRYILYKHVAQNHDIFNLFSGTKYFQMGVRGQIHIILGVLHMKTFENH